MSIILAIETSCDETAAAVIADGQVIRSNVVASQIEIHRRYGGVFPEVASRQHILAIGPVIQDAMTQARVAWNDLDAVAVTYGPGLAGSLLVGVNAAKGIALALGRPFIGVNHLEGHLYSNWLITNGELPVACFPALCLIASGGHTELVLVRDHLDYEVLGRTQDDAAGEVFDKVARLLDLGYPGGPAIEKAAERGDATAFDLPRARLRGTWDFSFSGLKTAVLRIVQRYTDEIQKPADALGVSRSSFALPVADLAASFQMAVVDILVEKTCQAAERYNVAEILLAGGVSANSRLRHEMALRAQRPVRVPPLWLCTDNAAMIGAAAHYHLMAGRVDGLDLDILPNLQL
ncbi:MAG: tRNA (adenosine(37)-N6)-threonylcarbamoyltransferase complex transferase subunit TsaD [Anaerolineae bacterium]